MERVFDLGQKVRTSVAVCDEDEDGRERWAHPGEKGRIVGIGICPFQGGIYYDVEFANGCTSSFDQAEVEDGQIAAAS